MTNIKVAKCSVKPFGSNDDLLVFRTNYEDEIFVICSYSESAPNTIAIRFLDHLCNEKKMRLESSSRGSL
jgi:hypothetical protein